MHNALDIRARVQLEQRRRKRKREAASAPTEWRQWLRVLFPEYFTHPFAEQHIDYWEWVWAIRTGVRPRPFIGIWSRGGAKSTSAEVGCVRLGVTEQRRYALYVRETQEQADKSVDNIASLLESRSVRTYYPDHAKRMVGLYGRSRGWRRNRLRTAGGFTVDAIGLDTAARGAKVEEDRPDVIIFDDIDGKHDSTEKTLKKLATIKTTILPAGSADCAVLGIQNLIIPHGVFTRLSDNRADFLVDRYVSGPYPAIRNLYVEREFESEWGKIRALIKGGEATWEGQSIEACQKEMDTIGLSAFLEENQHEVYDVEGALWSKAILEEHRVGSMPPMKRIVVGVDPSGGGDEIGIIVEGVGYDDHCYTIGDRSAPAELGPLFWGKSVVDAYYDFGADRVIAEANFGGDMVKSNIRVVDPSVSVKMVRASRGKAVRAEPVASLSEDGEHHMVGTFPELETELTSWIPGAKWSPNRLDAKVWASTDLKLRAARNAWGTGNYALS